MPAHHSLSPIQEQFRKNSNEKTLALQLELDMLGLAAQFRNKDVLPTTSTLVRRNWSSLPNKTVDCGPWPLRKNTVFIPAPPPTPNTAFKEGGMMGTSDGYKNAQLNRAVPPSLDPDNIMPFNDEIYSTPIPPMRAPMIPSPDCDSTTSATAPNTPNSDITIRQESYPPSLYRSNQDPLGTPVPRPGVETSSAPSVRKSQGSRPINNGAVLSSDCNQMVTQGMYILRSQGTRALVGALLEWGVADYRSATPVAAAAQSILGTLGMNAKDLANGLRVGAMEMFRSNWKRDGAWKMDRQITRGNYYLTLRGVNIAGLLGSLFTVGILTSDDLHLCLGLLINHSVEFDRLCAMHAIIVHSNDKLCKSKNVATTMAFRRRLSVKCHKTGRCFWADSGPSRILVTDIVDTIDRWLATQELKNAHSVSSPDGLLAR